MSKAELKSISKAMETQEYKDIMNDYMLEISDPKHKPELEQYLKECEERNDLPPGTKLIRPDPGFCIKTTSKRLVSETEKKYFDQKTFINVCAHDYIEKPKQVQ